ncbi:MAG TPA: hypothetical protein VFQ38_02225 [Longimicrobiales bacterium]|nr:hypothetical protein [Longimicrobiales bacterium]
MPRPAYARNPLAPGTPAGSAGPARRRLPGLLALPLVLATACEPPARGAGGAPAAETTGDAAALAQPVRPIPSVAIPFVGGAAAPAPAAAATHRPDTLPILAPRDTGGFPAVALAELADLDPRVTPQAWIAEHPEDAVTRGGAEPPASALDELDGDWCVLARRRLRLPDGRVALRSAYFFPPPMPAAGRLPPERADGRADLDECRLGAIRVEAETDETDTSGLAAARRLRRAFARRLGSPDTLRAARWPLSDYEALATWRLPGRWVVTGWRGYRQGVEAGAWAPVSGIDPSRDAAADPRGERPSLRQLADSAGLDPDLARDLLALADSAAVERTAPRDWSPSADSSLLDALRRWHDALPALPVERRAAALWLVDRVVSAAYRRTPADEAAGGPMRRQLDSLGIRSDTLPVSHEFGYSGNLAWDAYAAAPPGPLRQDVFLELLAAGFEDGGRCGHGGAQFRRVIQAGEKAAPEIEGDERQARLHVLLARAYGDVVAVASGVGTSATHLDTASYRPQAPGARRAALRHFQQALDLLPPGPTARAVWREAWRLRAGLPPVHTVFVCFDD